MDDPEKITESEVVPWLAFLAYASAAVSEGEMAAALGVDRAAVRETVMRGADVAKRVAEARIDRVRAMVTGERRLEALTGSRAHGLADESIRRLFSDGRERTVHEVAAALAVSAEVAAKRLERCAVVHRLRRGVWSLRSAP